MTIEYHPAVAQDVTEALRYYDSISERLAADFQSEVRNMVALAAANPKRFHMVKPGLHRANLKRFPYHILYRELLDGIRITLVRHHRRQPDFGMERK